MNLEIGEANIYKDETKDPVRSSETRDNDVAVIKSIIGYSSTLKNRCIAYMDSPESDFSYEQLADLVKAYRVYSRSCGDIVKLIYEFYDYDEIETCEKTVDINADNFSEHIISAKKAVDERLNECRERYNKTFYTEDEEECSRILREIRAERRTLEELMRLFESLNNSFEVYFDKLRSEDLEVPSAVSDNEDTFDISDYPTEEDEYEYPVSEDDADNTEEALDTENEDDEDTAAPIIAEEEIEKISEKISTLEDILAEFSEDEDYTESYENKNGNGGDEFEDSEAYSLYTEGESEEYPDEAYDANDEADETDEDEDTGTFTEEPKEYTDIQDNEPSEAKLEENENTEAFAEESEEYSDVQDGETSKAEIEESEDTEAFAEESEEYSDVQDDEPSEAEIEESEDTEAFAEESEEYLDVQDGEQEDIEFELPELPSETDISDNAEEKSEEQKFLDFIENDKFETYKAVFEAGGDIKREISIATVAGSDFTKLHGKDKWSENSYINDVFGIYKQYTSISADDSEIRRGIIRAGAVKKISDFLISIGIEANAENIMQLDRLCPIEFSAPDAAVIETDSSYILSVFKAVYDYLLSDRSKPISVTVPNRKKDPEPYGEEIFFEKPSEKFFGFDSDEDYEDYETSKYVAADYEAAARENEDMEERSEAADTEGKNIPDNSEYGFESRVSEAEKYNEYAEEPEPVRETGSPITMILNGKESVYENWSEAERAFCEYAIKAKPFAMALINRRNDNINGQKIFNRATYDIPNTISLSNGLQAYAAACREDFTEICGRVMNICSIEKDICKIIESGAGE